jgi:hypothetical protein
MERKNEDTVEDCGVPWQMTGLPLVPPDWYVMANALIPASTDDWKYGYLKKEEDIVEGW